MNAAEKLAYEKAKDEFMDRHPCPACRSCGRPAHDWHHPRGRHGENAGRIVPVCRQCHDRIHRNPAWATDAGLLERNR